MIVVVVLVQILITVLCTLQMIFVKQLLVYMFVCMQYVSLCNVHFRIHITTKYKQTICCYELCYYLRIPDIRITLRIRNLQMYIQACA